MQFEQAGQGHCLIQAGRFIPVTNHAVKEGQDV